MTGLILLLIVLFLQPLSCAAAAPVERNYLSRLQDTIFQARSNLPTLTKSADRAAHEFMFGGNLWVWIAFSRRTILVPLMA
jgi:hypothetical protein